MKLTNPTHNSEHGLDDRAIEWPQIQGYDTVRELQIGHEMSFSIALGQAAEPKVH